MAGMARRFVRVLADEADIRATLAFEGVAPLHAARTSQRDVPTTLNTKLGERARVRRIELQFDTGTRTIPEFVELRESSGRAGGSRDNDMEMKAIKRLNRALGRARLNPPR